MKFSLIIILLVFGVCACQHEPPLKKDENIYKKLPESHIDNGAFADSLPRIEIKLNRTNTALIDDEPCDIDTLEQRYFEAQDHHEGQAVVHFYVHNTTPYGNFSKVHAMIENYNRKVKWDYAMDHFDMHYDNLSGDQKRHVDNTFPMRIVEHKLSS